MNACFRTSLPMCSPSRSQSVQMNKILENLACCFMFSAMPFLSCPIVSGHPPRQDMCTHVFNSIEDSCIEKLPRRAGSPVLVLRLEFEARKMTENAGHGNRAIAPLLEVEVEFVVLDILVACDGMLSLCQDRRKVQKESSPTVTILPPLRCCATALAIAGFSATHRILVGGMPCYSERKGLSKLFPRTSRCRWQRPANTSERLKRCVIVDLAFRLAATTIPETLVGNTYGLGR